MAPSYRATNRQRLRESLIAAARDLTIARGWDGVRMADVADAVGVSRQTVYNEFDGKAALAEAMAAREIERFVADVRADLFAHGADIRAATAAAVAHTLTEAAANPLIKAILTSARGGADELLPYLTTRAELVLGAATAVIREWAAVYAPTVDERSVALGAESVVRLAVSHIVLALAPVEDTAAGLAELLVRLWQQPTGKPSAGRAPGR